jgi:hypothetical protein
MTITAIAQPIIAPRIPAIKVTISSGSMLCYPFCVGDWWFSYGTRTGDRVVITHVLRCTGVMVRHEWY